MTPSMVESIGAEYGFNGRFGERELGRRKEEIYKRFLLAQMKSPGGGRSGDVKELMRLKEVLGLGGVEVSFLEFVDLLSDLFLVVIGN